MTTKKSSVRSLTPFLSTLFLTCFCVCLMVYSLRMHISPAAILSTRHHQKEEQRDTNYLFNEHVNESMIWESQCSSFSEAVKTAMERIEAHDEYVKSVETNLLHKMDALRKQVREYEEQLFESQKLKFEFSSWLQDIHSKQEKIQNTFQTIETKGRQKIASLSSSAMSKVSTSRNLKLYSADVDKNQLDELKLKINGLHMRLDSFQNTSESRIGKIFDSITRLSDSTEQSSVKVQELKALVESHVSKAVSIRPVVVLPPNNLSLTVDTFLLPLWEQEKTYLHRIFRSLVCPFNPLHDFCLSDEQKRVRHLVNYADRTEGAEVVHTMTSPSFKHSSHSFLDSFVNMAAMLSLTEEAASLPPEVALSGDNSLGNCWPMAGTQGVFTVKLSKPLYVSSITIDHISSNEAIDISSAPRKFTVVGFEIDSGEEIPLLSGEYLVAKEIQDAVQNFPVTPTMTSMPAFDYIRLHIQSNHGNKDYTCLYRFRVHGSPGL